MKGLLSAVIYIAVVGGQAHAQLEIGGYLKTDSRLFLEEENDFYWNENRLDLKIESSPAEDSHLYGEMWIRTFGISKVSTGEDLMRLDKEKVLPWGLLIREAYLDFYGFMTSDLDIRIGLQRMAWGTGDKLNPTDNLNPDDLEDIWDFGRHLGSNSIKATYYLGDYRLTAVYIPVFTPATLPIKEWSGALAPQLDAPTGFLLSSLSDNIITPEANLKESSMAGLKIASQIQGYDFSLSYFYGRDDIPFLCREVYVSGLDPQTADVMLEFVYPRIQVLGLDIAGAVGNVGVWAEGAVFFPEKVYFIKDLSGVGGSVRKFIALDDPYFKFVVGGDYTLKSGWYINGQFLHGFIQERGNGELNDYLVLSLEKKLLNDELEIAPVGIGLEIAEFDEIKNNYAIALMPEITYYPHDNSEIDIGIRILEGKESTTFGAVKNNDEIYLNVKYSF